MVFPWSLSNKFPQVFRTFFNILANLKNTVVWIVSTHPFMPKSSSRCTNPLVTVPSASITIGISITFRLYIYLNPFAKSWSISLFTYLQFYAVVSRNDKVHHSLGSHFFLFLFYFLLLLGLVEIRWSIRISKSQKILCVSFSRTDSGLCIYHLFIWSNLNFLHYSL